MISENLLEVRQEIQNSCALVSRNPEEVNLVVVTKSVGTQEMTTLYQLGERNFAENRVDVLLEKQEALKAFPGIQWHFIVHLQR